MTGAFRALDLVGDIVFPYRFFHGNAFDFLERGGVEVDGKLVIPERLTQKDIAARVGASREMINRILRDLTTGGYVSVNDGRITINKAPPARW